MQRAFFPKPRAVEVWLRDAEESQCCDREEQLEDEKTVHGPRGPPLSRNGGEAREYFHDRRLGIGFPSLLAPESCPARFQEVSPR